MGQYGLRDKDGRAIIVTMAVIGAVSIASVALRIASRVRDLNLGMLAMCFVIASTALVITSIALPWATDSREESQATSWSSVNICSYLLRKKDLLLYIALLSSHPAAKGADCNPGSFFRSEYRDHPIKSPSCCCALPLVTARVAQEHNIFQTLVANKDEPTSVAVLAEKTKINPVILDILLDYLSTQFMVEEVSPQHYKATKLSNILVAPLFIDGVLHFHDNCLPAFNALNYSLAHPTD
ncbi:hypothetical protein V496_03995 [Pseudogymnoascus sp. VKM F-4515 (FW-2607)]|nr:hypothetical protein V496_03995 [Pseudogymnoascus sp. VKM F-4515 (FW-2607)]